MNQRFDRGQSTRSHIVETATRLFAAEGFEAISVEAVLTACGLSRGALYHHFASKEAVFRAVLEQVEAQIAGHVASAAQDATNPLDALRAGCSAWLRLAAGDAMVRQIVLTDGPSVVGWKTWREIDEANSLGLLRSALSLAAEAGRIRPDRVDLFAHVLLAVLVEVALMLARAPDDPALAEAGEETVEQVLSGLFGLKPHEAWT